MQAEIGQLDLRYAALVARRRRQEEGALARASRGEAPYVVVVLEGPRLVVIDGFEQVSAARRLGQETAEVTVWPLTAGEGLVLCQRIRQRRLSALEEGWLIEQLRTGEGLDDARLAGLIGRSPGWVTFRRRLVSTLPASVQERVRRGQIDPQVASGPLYELARMSPRACERLAEAIAGKGLTRAEVLEVVRAYRRSTCEGRARLLGEPLLYLKSRREDDALVKKARALVGMAQAIRKGLGAVPRGTRVEVRSLVKKAEDILASTLEQEDEDVAARGASDDLAASREGNGDPRDRQVSEGLAGSGQEGDRPGDRRTKGNEPPFLVGDAREPGAGADRAVPQEPREGPRGAGRLGGVHLVSGADGLRQEEEALGEDPGGPIPLRARPGAPARHLSP
jgi:ParB-like chromosome segregation protein Spo0J